MAGTAARVEQIHHETGLEEPYFEEWRLKILTEPPRYALVSASERGVFATEGPYTQEQFDTCLGTEEDVELTAREQEIMYANPLGYEAKAGDVMDGRIWVSGEYPGGRDNAALNLARFVLGAE